MTTDCILATGEDVVTTTEYAQLSAAVYEGGGAGNAQKLKGSASHLILSHHATSPTH